MPKYTHEEMHEAFTEEEIRFAKRVALQKTINETLENAKIIIDAKNELLFAAFNDAYDDETYKEEYHQFCEITNDFIRNLNDLIDEAQPYGLDSEINTINQVINFLMEVMEEIPKTLPEAKQSVKIQLMKEQLQNEAEQVISNAENIRAEFISLYSKVYLENISKEDFKTYYNILKIGIIDALSQLDEIYDLLKKAELDELFEKVGTLIGTLNQDLKMYSGKYQVAQAIGKREALKEQIKNSMLSFTEYKTKILSIMSSIIDDPTLDNVQLRVMEGRALTSDFSSRFEKISKEKLKDSEFSYAAKDLYKDAKVIYKKRCKLHEKLSKVFENTEKKEITKDNVEVLKESVETSEEEIEAIKLLHDVYILFGQHEEYMEITDGNLKKLRKEVNGYLEKSEDIQNYLESMLEYIEYLVKLQDELNNNKKALDLLKKFDLRELASKVNIYQNTASVLRFVANLSGFGLIAYALVFGDYETGRQIEIASKAIDIPEELPALSRLAVSIFVPLKMIASGFYHRSSSTSDKLLLYRQLDSLEKKYQNLFNRQDSYLQDIYQRTLNM